MIAIPMSWPMDERLPDEPVYDAELDEEGNLINHVPWRLYRDGDGYLWRATNVQGTDIEVNA